MTSKQLQKNIKKILTPHFGDSVVVEWSVSKGASDGFSTNRFRYAPRVDVAVKPFVSLGNHLEEILGIWENKSPKKLSKRLSNLRENRNPRCVLAIEVVFSGSSKHILGDIMNASMLGLYGIIVPSEKMMPKVKRAFEYVKKVKELGKLSDDVFENVCILSRGEFLNMCRDDSTEKGEK